MEYGLTAVQLELGFGLAASAVQFVMAALLVQMIEWKIADLLLRTHLLKVLEQLGPQKTIH